MKTVLSHITSKVELCKIAQLCLLFPIPHCCELLHDFFNKDQTVRSCVVTLFYIKHNRNTGVILF